MKIKINHSYYFFSRFFYISPVNTEHWTEKSIKKQTNNNFGTWNLFSSHSISVVARYIIANGSMEMSFETHSGVKNKVKIPPKTYIAAKSHKFKLTVEK